MPKQNTAKIKHTVWVSQVKSNSMEGRYDVVPPRTKTNVMEAEYVVERLIIDGDANLTASIKALATTSMFGFVEAVEPPIVDEVYNPVEDAFVRESKPRLNYGTTNGLAVGYKASEDGNQRAFLRFEPEPLTVLQEYVSAKLVLHHKSGDPRQVTLYTTEGDWTETGITWMNRPYLQAPSVGTKTPQNGTVEWDLTELLRDWAEGRTDDFPDFGIIETLTGTDPIEFYSRESSVGKPELIISYKRREVRTNNSYLPGEIAVRQASERDLKGHIEVTYPYDVNDLPANFNVRIPWEMPSHVIVSKPAMPAEMRVRQEGEADLEGNVAVRVEEIHELPAMVNVSRPTLEASMTVQQEDESEIEGSVTVRQFVEDDLDASLYISRPDLPAHVLITVFKDLEATVAVRRDDEHELEAGVYISRPDLPAHVRITVFKDLDATMTVRAEDWGDLDATINVSRPVMPARIAVQQEDESEIEGTMNVRAYGELNVPSKLYIARPSIEGSMVVRQEGEGDMPSMVAVRRDAEHDLPASVHVLSGYLRASVNVLPVGTSDIMGHTRIRGFDADDLLATIKVGRDGPSYKTSGYRLLDPIDLNQVGTAIGSKITWSATEPADTTVRIEVSYDDGETWLEAVNEGEIPELGTGDVRGRVLLVRQSLFTASPDVTPILHSMEIEIESDWDTVFRIDAQGRVWTNKKIPLKIVPRMV